MAFRDDREALLQRVASLEHALAEQQAGLAQSEAQRASLQAQLADARGELERLRPFAPQAPPKSRRGLVLALVTIGLFLGSAMAVVSLRSTAPMPSAIDIGPPIRRDAPAAGAGAPLPAGATGCRSNCDCAHGAGCVSGQCLMGTAPSYCCNDPRCPSGESCDRVDGTMAVCGAARDGGTR